MSAARDPYALVGAVTRRAIETVGRADLKAAALRVFIAILHHLATWSRLEDEVSRAELAEIVGVSEATLKRHLPKLVDLGVIAWRPGRRQVPSMLSLIVPPDILSGSTCGPVEEDSQRVNMRTRCDIHSGSETTSQRVRNAPTAGQHVDPPPRTEYPRQTRAPERTTSARPPKAAAAVRSDDVAAAAAQRERHDQQEAQRRAEEAGQPRVSLAALTALKESLR
jgi:hypothetical protein